MASRTLGCDVLPNADTITSHSAAWTLTCDVKINTLVPGVQVVITSQEDLEFFGTKFMSGVT